MTAQPATARFTLVISGAPYTSQAPQSALRFAEAVLSAGHAIERVFLYGDGVHLASSYAAPPSDEPDWPEMWAEFLQQHRIAATCCVASALRRGLLDHTEARRYQRPGVNVRSCYTVAGLGDWLEAEQAADRTLYFKDGGG
ncbi:tRNA 2-thiouridine synthesizing protein D [Tamilnaduibacter salinus]|uniref:tRNA 2-thiouridine synthesizing protein D n=1 Tax=Tamilnaduibacter salinus TaxID=1484056 RepID=A0A2U1CZH5_9GAMM|nr:sulfurtransferase complex subunit TusD [Tamilnaduibacter salinus]PVY78196.1 tRNA 2-thiouridine synthesizing protein D [Tamilnaduibacter salinus]